MSNYESKSTVILKTQHLRSKSGKTVNSNNKGVSSSNNGFKNANAKKRPSLAAVMVQVPPPLVDNPGLVERHIRSHAPSTVMSKAVSPS